MLSEAVTTDKGRAPSGRERRWTLDWDVPLGRRPAVPGYKRSPAGICVTDGLLAKSQSSHARNCGHTVNTTMRAPTDEELVDRARVGDLGSFERLVERHRDVVYRVAARVVGPDDASDVSQDTFLRAFHRLDQLSGEGSFRAWLLQITHNAAVSHVERRRPEPVDPTAPEAEVETDRSQTPALLLEQRERVRRLETKIRLLKVEHRTVLVLRDVEGLSYEEVGEATETPIGSVKGRLHRARRELIDLLRRNTYDWELPE
jgi:RNA polymerase sigma-70 factor (ECF subfamily)